MKRFRFLYAAACLLLASSCIKEQGLDDLTPSFEGRNGRIVHTKSGADEYSLLFKLKSSEDRLTLEHLESLGFVEVKRLFLSTPGKEALEAEFGLDRWYSAKIKSGDIDEYVVAAAGIKGIELVEYNVNMKKASDCILYPYDGPEPQTKAEALPFNDPSLIDQWHYLNQGNASIATSVKKGADINVVDVWGGLTAGDPSIIVAVVDEAVKYSHPDLKENMWVNTGEIPGNGIDDDKNGYVDDIYGYNFVTGGELEWTAEGNSGHGTHCAGTIAAVNNNGRGVSGVAGGTGKGDGCRIMSCQIFSGGGGASVANTAKAIKYAADMGASIISCSFGYTSAFPSDDAYIRSQGSAEIDAIHYFEACRNNPVLNGNIAIFAAGNDAHDYAHYPGAYHDIISVTAFGPDYLPTHYTNYGPGCNICAPGGEAYLPPWKSYKAMVLSTVPTEVNSYGSTSTGKGNEYGYMQGTSMACPHVSGVVALALSYAKKLGKTFDREEFKNMIITSANDLDSKLKGTKTLSGRPALDLAKFYHKLGTGSIDAWLLMMQIEGIPCITAEIGKNQWLDISPYFGTASTSLTYLEVEVSERDREALGLAQDPYIEYGRLFVHPTKHGSAKIKVSAVGGGNEVGGGDKVGGMKVTQEISIIARSFKSSDNAWL